MRKSVYTEVEVDVDIDLEDFSDEELLEEIKFRKILAGTDLEAANRLLEEIYIKRVTNKDYTTELDKYLYEVLGRIV